MSSSSTPSSEEVSTQNIADSIAMFLTAIDADTRSDDEKGKMLDGAFKSEESMSEGDCVELAKDAFSSVVREDMSKYVKRDGSKAMTGLGKIGMLAGPKYCSFCKKTVSIISKCEVKFQRHSDLLME